MSRVLPLSLLLSALLAAPAINPIVLTATATIATAVTEPDRLVLLRLPVLTWLGTRLGGIRTHLT